MPFQLKRVLITESVDPSCEQILKAEGVEVVTKTGLSKPQLLEEIGQDYDGLIVRSATKVTADVIEAGKHLSVIGRAGTGVDNIDCPAATQHGVLVLNAPSGNTLSAAELTCGMIVTLSRNIPQACASMKTEKWERKNFMGTELWGKTLAIIGLGRIGREVAARMQAFGMKTIGFDPLVPADVSITFGVESLSLEEIWPIADYITIHTPLIPQTKNMVNDDVFSKCKKGVKFVNCARGGIIDEAALVRALDSGICSGAGFDTYVEEPPKDWTLVKHPKVIATPHLGASTVEAQKRVAVEVAQQFVDLLKGQFVPGIVNSPSFCHSLIEENRYWVSLCQALGAILAALVSEVPESGMSVTVGLQGTELSQKGKVLEVATLVGLLQHLKFSEANFVNAQVLAKGANIQVSSSNNTGSGDTGLQSAIMLMVEAGNASHSVIGTVRGKEPYLMSIDGIQFESAPKLTDSLVLCRGKHGHQMLAKLIEVLVENGSGFDIHCSSPFQGRCWCVVNGKCPSKEAPDSTKDSIDFWAQLTL